MRCFYCLISTAWQTLIIVMTQIAIDLSPKKNPYQVALEGVQWSFDYIIANLEAQICPNTKGSRVGQIGNSCNRIIGI